jgi:transcription initiation factor TFIIIB Brf1 subunit/transcription initiation factor TFIIB
MVLTPTEKLVARAIVNAERDQHAPPSRAEIATMVRISEKDVDRAVAMLARYDILKVDHSAGGIGYVATKPRYVFWQQWLDFQFHRVSLASGRTFCVH